MAFFLETVVNLAKQKGRLIRPLSLLLDSAVCFHVQRID